MALAKHAQETTLDAAPSSGAHNQNAFRCESGASGATRPHDQLVELELEPRATGLVWSVCDERGCSTADLLEALCCQLPHIRPMPPLKPRRRFL